VAAAPRDEAPLTWITSTVTAGVGRGTWTGVLSWGTAGIVGGGGVRAVAKLAALTADSAPARAADPATPPPLHRTTRRRARSRSLRS
jgi:hypothetical protein